MAEGDFDPEAYVSGGDTQEALPTVTPSLTTFYYPSTPEDTHANGLSYKMEGGIHGAGKFSDVDLRNHTLEKFLAGESPFVAVAKAGHPEGSTFTMNVNGTPIVAKNVDTGGGLRPGQVDVATANPELARSGIQRGDGSGFDPAAFAEGKPSFSPAPSQTPAVPDIHAFFTDTPDKAEATPTELPEPEGAIPAPDFSRTKGLTSGFQVPTFQPQPIPQGGAQITPTPPPPIPQPMPTPGTQAQVPPQPFSMAMFAQNLPKVAQQTLGDLKGMVNAPVELSQQAMDPNRSIPSRLAAAAGVVASAAQFDPLMPRAASKEIPGAFAGAELPPGGRPITAPDRPAPQLPEPAQFSVDMPTDAFGTEQTPVASAVMEMGGLTSKSTAKRLGLYNKNPALWETAPRLSHPTHGKIYPSTKVPIVNAAGETTGFRSIGVAGETPENAARNLYRAGLIPDEYVDTMWAALDKESKSSRANLKSQRGEAKTIQEGGKLQTQQAKSFINAEYAAWHGGEPPIPVKDLQVGDTVKVGGEQFKVTDIDPDTHDVTLEDGRKFGVQTVQDGTVIYGEHESSYGVKSNVSPTDRPDFTKGSIHINLRGETLDPSKPLTGWTLPAERGDFPNAMNTKYGKAGLTAVYVPKEWLTTSKTRPEKIKPGYFPPPENIAVIPSKAIRPSGTVDWTKVFKQETPPVEPPAAPTRPPPQRPRSSPPPKPAPKAPEPLNPVADGGPFRRTFRIDKELGEKMDAIGAAPETGALMSEQQHMNMTHELTPQQEAALGQLLVSDRMKGVNPNHPQVLPDAAARAIEADPAIKKALDYYRKEIEPEVEDLHKRAGTTEASIAPQRGQYISLIPERLKDGTIPSLVPTASRMSRTTKFARPAEGLAAKYSTNLYDILRESYTEAIRKAATRDLYDAAEAKGVAAPSSQFVRDRGNPDPNAGKWVKSVQFTDLPAEMRGDLDLIARHGNTLPPLGAEKILRAYQSTATAIQLGLNPLELQNHMRRALAVAAAKPPIGQGIVARMEWLLPYFGPKIGTMKRAMSDMTPMRQQILRDITEQGGGSTRAMGLHASGLSNPAKKLLFGVPRGKGVMGFDLRLRTVLEEIRRNAEPSMRNDKQRMRQFANGLGQYGTMASWPVRALRNVNPYAATTLPMRASELKMLFGDAGFKGETWPKATLHRVETFLRGTGGTIAMLTMAQKLLTGTYPWDNSKGHEFDLKTGVKDKNGNDIYVNNRFISPEFFRAISTIGFPSVLKERGAARPDYVSAAATGPINAAASLVNSPGLSLALAAGPQVALYGVRDPGQHGLDLMKVGRSSRADEERGVPPLLKRAEGVAEQLHPLPAAVLGYMDEPIKGLKPLGMLSVDRGPTSGGGYSRSSSGRGGSGRGGSGRGRGGR